LRRPTSPRTSTAARFVAFAQAAKEPFAAVEKSLDESTRAEYGAFWREYDERLDRAAHG
jgi:hypothetical protein